MLFEKILTISYFLISNYTKTATVSKISSKRISYFISFTQAFLFKQKVQLIHMMLASGGMQVQKRIK